MEKKVALAHPAQVRRCSNHKQAKQWAGAHTKIADGQTRQELE